MKKKIIFIILVCLFIIDLILVINDNMLNIDDSIHNFLYHDSIVDLMKIITFFGGSIGVPIITAIGFITLFLRKKRKEGLSIIIIVVLTTIINVILKLIIGRDRPDYILIEESLNSFPSGHAMGSTALYGYFVYLTYKSNLRKSIKIILSIIFILLILGICISRIILGAHYFSDIIGGIIFSVIIIMVYNYFYQKIVLKTK